MMYKTGEKQGVHMSFVLFYTVMLVVLLSWNNGEIAPPMYMRLAYLTMLLLPITFIKRYLYYFPVILTIFVSISKFMFSFSYMPTDENIYCVLAFFWFAAIHMKGGHLNNSNNFVLRSLLLSFIYTCIVDLIDTGSLTAISYSIIIILILFLAKTKVSSSLLLTSFSIVSFVLSLSLIILRDQFAIDYGTTGLERSSWTDPNYFGCLIGIGVVSSMIKLRSFSLLNLFEKIFYISVCVSSLIAIIINASRGAVLAIGVAFIINMFSSQNKAKYKLLFAIGVIFSLWVLYTNNYFELLFYRIENDSNEGSGRVDIWITKLNAFINSSNPLNILFGCGNQGGLYLGYSYLRGFHNDFIAILVEYGMIGFTIIMYLLIRPIKLAKKAIGAKSAAFIILSYLFVVMATLEPLTIGYLPYWLIVYLYLMVSTETKNIV